jgi:hypothetical protein
MWKVFYVARHTHGTCEGTCSGTPTGLQYVQQRFQEEGGSGASRANTHGGKAFCMPLLWTSFFGQVESNSACSVAYWSETICVFCLQPGLYTQCDSQEPCQTAPFFSLKCCMYKYSRDKFRCRLCQICVNAEYGNWTVSTIPPLQLPHHHSWHIATVLIAMVMWTLPRKVFLFIPCWCGSTALKKCTLLFCAYSVLMPTPERPTGSLVANVICVNDVTRCGCFVLLFVNNKAFYQSTGSVPCLMHLSNFFHA